MKLYPIPQIANDVKRGETAKELKKIKSLDEQSEALQYVKKYFAPELMRVKNSIQNSPFSLRRMINSKKKLLLIVIN